MLSHISWQQYLTAVGLATLAYYLIISLLFFKKELLRLLTGNKPGSPLMPFTAPTSVNLMGPIQEFTGEPANESEQGAAEPESLSGQSLEFSPDDNLESAYTDEAAVSDTFDELEQLSIRLRLLMEKSGSKANRTELTELIRKELAAFSASVNPENFKEAVNRFVKHQCMEICHVRIEPADLKFIWSDFR